MSEEYPFRIYGKPELQSSSLIVGWSEDVSKLGAKVTDYLNRKLGSIEFGEIEPLDFFPLSGVSVEDDIALFPESRFYYCPEKSLVIFKSDSPKAEWHRFLNSVLDVAEQYCHVKEIYTIGGMVSPSAHTSPRELLAIANSPNMKKGLNQYNLALDMDYETPPGQRPTLSSFLIWVCRNRNIDAASLWVPIPFYLVTTEDPASCKKIVEFFDQRFNLGLDLKDLDTAVVRQNKKIAQIRAGFPEINSSIRNLEDNLALSQEEGEKLAKELEEYLRRIE